MAAFWMYAKDFSLLCLFALGCSSFQNEIKSFPEGADVFLVDQNGSRSLVGKTPLNIPQTMREFTLEKDGYENFHVFAGSAWQESHRFTVTLKKKDLDLKKEDFRGKQEKLAKSLAVAHGLISSRRLDDADRSLKLTADEFPYVSVTFDLLGNVSYLRKDYQMAIGYYEKSLALNPENFETKQVLQKLRSFNR